ncbi:Predicted Fe-Mo cluster-binding protein, NifX family [Saccharicrinis carchari]|uniref:Predicted Fe-Mo cluster-binding protein, NifX family n=1 Tax=Saccharicrinis carchari TaxID=1168039 RepID=A0A521AJ50_SACCC|nr:NifB/NifX family molybdenum-iron cluster-binding protein [Saccharicrinis carchari]SMO34842.1 Predicted Fe-Mo cluster-binding protein, NifX family [Saccharicrinis carchari]
MKTVITSSGDSLSSLFDMRFGRAEYFCIYDSKTGESKFLKNENKDNSSGAGVKVAERMIELGITQVVSGDFGPKAKNLLDKFNIQMVILQNAGLSIDDIVQKMKNK